MFHFNPTLQFCQMGSVAAAVVVVELDTGWVVAAESPTEAEQAVQVAGSQKDSAEGERQRDLVGLRQKDLVDLRQKDLAEGQQNRKDFAVAQEQGRRKDQPNPFGANQPN